MMGRALRTRLDLLRPNVESQVLKQQASQKQYHDNHSRVRVFTVGDKVLAKNFRAGPKWVQGTIVDCLSSVTYRVKVFHNMLWRRHVDHLHRIAGSDQEGSANTSMLEPSDEFTMLPGTLNSEPAELNTPTLSNDNTRRYPQRIRHPPKRYQ